MMSLFLGHASHVSHFATHATASHVATHAGGGIMSELVHSFIHGIAWRAGGRVINIVPMPILLIIIAIVGIFFLVRYLRNRHAE